MCLSTGIRYCLIACSLLVMPVLADPPQSDGSASAGASAAVRPAPREDEWWRQRNEVLNQRVKPGDAQILFIGDSITEGWEHEGKEVWEEHYAPRKAVSLGIGGDQTQHVLWRLEHGNLEGISPKVAVVMIGTNNSNGNDFTAEEIADGITAVVRTLRERLPKTRVLLLAIFPRGEKPSPQREKCAKASQLASRIADGKMVTYLDIGSRFVGDDGTISPDIMPDYLHLSRLGYERWAEAIDPALAELLEQ